MSARGATSASTSSIRSRARRGRWPASRRSRRIPIPCARPSTQNYSGRWRRPCRKAFHATNATPGASSSAARKPICRRRSSASKPARPAATGGRPGSGRWRRRGCRSTTCTGRRPCWWRSQAARRARPGASASPTGAFFRCRSTTPPPSASSCSTTWCWCAWRRGRNCACVRWCREWWSCLRTRAAASSP